MLLVIALGATACSQTTDEQPFPGQCAPFGVVRWQPNENDENVPRDLPVRLQLDDYPDPDTVGYDGVIVTSGVYYWSGTFTTDLIGKAVTFHAQGPLSSTLTYGINVRPPFRSLRGCVAVEQRITFRTGEELLATQPPAVVPATFSDVRTIFARSCGGATCHRAAAEAGGGCLASPAAGLSLCDRDALTALVGVPSTQVSRLVLVAPGDSSRSYLLRKLLPGDTADVPAPTTLGHRDPPGAPLSEADLRAVATWIDAGARSGTTN